MPYRCPKFKEINPWEWCLWLAQIYFCKLVRSRRKMWRKLRNFQEHISRELLLFLVCRVVCMEGIKYVNLIEISTVVIKKKGWKRWVSSSCKQHTCMPHVFLGHWHTTVCLDADYLMIVYATVYSQLMLCYCTWWSMGCTLKSCLFIAIHRWLVWMHCLVTLA